MSNITTMGSVGADDTLASNKPDIGRMLMDLKRCTPLQNGYDHSVNYDDIRFCRWEDQHPDFKKHDRGGNDDAAAAQPFDGASDLRTFLVDDIINQDVNLLMSAFWRAFPRAHGLMPDPQGIGTGAAVTAMLNYFVKNRQNVELQREVELSAQYLRHYGWCALFPHWQREVNSQLQPVKLDDLNALAQAVAQGDPGNDLALLPEFIADEAAEDVAIELLQKVYDLYVANEVKTLEMAPPKLKVTTARRMVRELRETGETSVPVPKVTRNQPSILALRPWQDIFLPTDVGDIQRGRAYVRWFYTEEELRAKVLTDGWDADWVEQAIKTRGSTLIWNFPNTNLTDMATAWMIQRDTQSRLIEVFYGYTRRLDEDGVPGVYCTVFNIHATRDTTDTPAASSASLWNPDDSPVEICAVHGLVDYEHGLVPLVLGASEWTARSVTWSRGVPEKAAPLQRLEKVTADALVDRTSLTVLPPLLLHPKDIDSGFRWAPLAQNPLTPGRAITPLSLPPEDGTAAQVLSLVEAKRDASFGRASAAVAPMVTQLYQTNLVNRFLAMWNEALQQEVALIWQYGTDEQFAAVTGNPKPAESVDAIMNRYPVQLTLDPRELDMDYTLKMLESVSQLVLPFDAGGTIDKTRLVQLALQAINPILASELVTNPQQASQQLFNGVRDDLAQMALGNPPQLTENDPTAPAKLQYAQQVIQSNPKYQQALQQDPHFAELVQQYMRNLNFSVQQAQNKVVGRVGVNQTPGGGQ